MSLSGKVNFAQWPLTTVEIVSCHSEQHVDLSLSTHWFSSVHFSFSALNKLEQLSHLQQSPVPFQFPLPDVVIATDAMHIHWAFIFRVSGLPLSVSRSQSGSMCRAYIAL